jgi:hypothetical protein
MWEAEMEQERRLLRGAAISHFDIFKQIVLGDRQKPLPVNKSPTELIDDYLSRKYRSLRAAEARGWAAARRSLNRNDSSW